MFILGTTKLKDAASLWCTAVQSLFLIVQRCMSDASMLSPSKQSPADVSLFYQDRMMNYELYAAPNSSTKKKQPRIYYLQHFVEVTHRSTLTKTFLFCISSPSVLAFKRKNTGTHKRNTFSSRYSVIYATVFIQLISDTTMSQKHLLGFIPDIK